MKIHGVGLWEDILYTNIVPRRLAFFWGGGPLPLLRYEGICSAERLNPEWEIFLFHDTTKYASGTLEGDHLADAYFGEDYLPRLPARVQVIPYTSEVPCPSPVHASDLFRWQWLGEGGGVYADTDVLFVRPLKFLPFRPSFRTAFVPLDTDDNYTIGLLAATEEDSFFLRVYENCLDRLQRKDVRDRQALGVVALHEEAKGHLGEIQFWPPLIYACTGSEAEILLDEPWLDEEVKSRGKRLMGIHWFGGADEFRARVGGRMPTGLRNFVGEEA